MRIFLLASLLFIRQSIPISNAQVLDWAVGFGRGYSGDVTTDVSGNIYVVGSFLGTVDFDPGAGIFNLYASTSYHSDAFIEKLDPNGNFLWARSAHGHPKDDEFLSVTTDLSGNVYCAGFAQNDSIGIDLDILVDKFDSSGNLIWQKVIGGNYFDMARSILCDQFGNIYVSGSQDIPGPSNNVFVWKLDSAGNQIWSKAMGGYGSWELAFDMEQNIYICGDYGGSIDANPDTGVFILPAHGGYDLFLTKLDSNANFIWAKSIGGTGNDQALALDIDSSGNIYVNGLFNDTVDFDPGPTIVNLVCDSLYQSVFILKLDSSGAFTWVRPIIGAHHGGNSMNVDDAGNVYSTGYFYGTVDFDPGNADFFITAVGSSAYIQTLDASGNFLSVFSIDSARGHSIKLLSPFEFITSGTFVGIQDFDPGPGTYNLSSTHGSIYVQKINEFDVGVHNQIQQNDISFFPNPVKDILNIRTNSEIKSIELFDVLGIEQSSPLTFLKNNKAELIVSSLLPGIFFIKIQFGDGKISIGKFMKE
jgi:hypothetical protein